MWIINFYVSFWLLRSPWLYKSCLLSFSFLSDLVIFDMTDWSVCLFVVIALKGKREEEGKRWVKGMNRMDHMLFFKTSGTESNVFYLRISDLVRTRNAKRKVDAISSFNCLFVRFSRQAFCFKKLYIWDKVSPDKAKCFTENSDGHMFWLGCCIW